MKDNIKASLIVGAVYAVGGYLGYRAGKSKGKLEVHLEQLKGNYNQLDKLLKEKYPEKFEDEES